MIVNHNLASINAWRSVQKTDSEMTKSLEKLSSGLRINRAADDAAGLAISEKMRAQINGLDICKRNAMDGISMIQTAEGAMSEVSSMLQRIREIGVQASNGTYSNADKTNIQVEVTELLNEIDNLSKNTKFNGLSLLDGTFATTGISFQLGVSAGDTLSIKVSSIKTDSLGLAAVTGNTTVTDLSKVDVIGNTAESLKAIDSAIDDVVNRRANIGAYQNRLEHTTENLSVTSENLTAAESRIRDTDMALEMANFTKSQVLMQSGVAMLAQANQKTQSVLKLLG